MIEFSPLSAETRDMELASTRSRIKGWRRYRRPAPTHLSAVRTVYGEFSVESRLAPIMQDFTRDGVLVPITRAFAGFLMRLTKFGRNYERKQR